VLTAERAGRHGACGALHERKIASGQDTGGRDIVESILAWSATVFPVTGEQWRA